MSTVSRSTSLRWRAILWNLDVLVPRKKQKEYVRDELNVVVKDYLESLDNLLSSLNMIAAAYGWFKMFFSRN